MVIKAKSPTATKADVNGIVNTLSITDKRNLGVDRITPYQSERNPCVIYHREILYDNDDTPIAFFDVYSTGVRPGIAICVRSDMQNMGYGRIITFFGMQWVHQHLPELKLVEWSITYENTRSLQLAKRFGFTYYSHSQYPKVKTYVIKSA